MIKSKTQDTKEKESQPLPEADAPSEYKADLRQRRISFRLKP